MQKDSDENFHGCKIALFFGDKLVMCLRDDKPEIPYPNTWDFPGGGRENGESPFECVSREVEEELSIKLSHSQIIWRKDYISKLRPDSKSVFFVAEVTPEQVGAIRLGDEGQQWTLIPTKEFLSADNVVPHHKNRLRDFLER